MSSHCGGPSAQPGGGDLNITEILAGLDRSTAWLGAPRVASRATSASRMTRAQRAAKGLYSDAGSQACIVHPVECKLGEIFAVDNAVQV